MPACHAGGRGFEPLLSRFVETTFLHRKYGSLAQLGEHLPYKQRVTGSSPVTSIFLGGVAQLARACGSYPQCRGFKSLLRYHNGVSPSGKATDSDSVIRRFESCYPSHTVARLRVTKEQERQKVAPVLLFQFCFATFVCA